MKLFFPYSITDFVDLYTKRRLRVNVAVKNKLKKKSLKPAIRDN